MHKKGVAKAATVLQAIKKAEERSFQGYDSAPG
jgi:hypothetical protein